MAYTPFGRLGMFSVLTRLLLTPLHQQSPSERRTPSRRAPAHRASWDLSLRYFRSSPVSVQASCDACLESRELGGDLCLQLFQRNQKFVRGPMHRFLVHHLLVPVDAQVEALFDVVCLRNTETLGSSRSLAFVGIAALPPREHVRQVDLHVLFWT